KAIAMTNVLHHLPRVREFLAESARCVRSGGVLTLIEPWVSAWSKRVYKGAHHEPFVPRAMRWEFETSGPLSGANGALPWIIFQRDRQQLEQEFPEWHVESVRPMMPLRYLLSGGVSMRSLVPGWTSGFWATVEQVLGRWNRHLAMFAHVVVRRT